MVADSISDTLIRIKNGYACGSASVAVLPSKMVLAVCEAMKKGGFLSKVEKSDTGLVVSLKYSGKAPALNGVKRISKPGCRVYIGSKKIRKVLSGRGMAIVSTPLGVISGQEAREKNVGGEYLCEIW